MNNYSVLGIELDRSPASQSAYSLRNLRIMGVPPLFCGLASKISDVFTEPKERPNFFLDSCILFRLDLTLLYYSMIYFISICTALFVHSTEGNSILKL